MTPTIIDISHHNGDVDFDKIASSGICAVFMKVTQYHVDPMYNEYHDAAVAAGLAVGGYHFGVGESSGADQAHNFLSNFKGGVIALDLESNTTTGATMSMEQAEEFCETIAANTGKYPVLYSGNLVKQYLAKRDSATFAKCPFWLAQYGPRAVVPSTWSAYTFWQFSENYGTADKSDDGVGLVDADVFNGTLDEFRAFWNENQVGAQA